MDQAVDLPDGDDDAGCAVIEFDRPLPVVVDIEAGDSLYSATLLDQALRQGTAFAL